MTPALFETIAWNGSGIDGLPEPENPYYIVANEGFFLHRKTQIGNVILKEATKPKSLGKIGYDDGVFVWQGPKLPGSIISQAHDFFRRVYLKHHSEAEVLITMHNDTGAFRLFVPHQRVSHTGVKSVYEPSHVSREYTVVGTLHSHCDFTAFHSATDSGDASDMDGVHFTIGHVNANVPEIVAMVTMGGKEFHYKDPAMIATIEYNTETAPPWWDAYVYPAETQSEKPKTLRSITQAQWDEFRGLAKAKPKVLQITQIAKWTPSYDMNKKPASERRDDKSWDWRAHVYGADDFSLSKESIAFNARKLIEKSDDGDAIDEALDLAEDYHVFGDDDWVKVPVGEINKKEYWQNFFASRLADMVNVLSTLGLEVEYEVNITGEI